MAAEQSSALPKVPARIIQPRKRARVAMEVLGMCHATERSCRGEPSRFRGEASALEFVFEQVKVRLKLATEIRFRAPWTASVDQSEEESPQGRHRQPLFSSSLFTRPASRCH